MDDYSKCDFREYYEIIRETKKAWLLHIVNDKERWFAKSICELDKKANWVIMPQWLSDVIWGESKPKHICKVPAYLDASPRYNEDEFYDPYEFH